MNTRWLLAGIATGTLLLGCGSGEGLPKAAVRNNLNLCIVQAAWIHEDGSNRTDYGWSDAIGKGGQTVTREMIVGTGTAYAVAVAADNCYEAAKHPGGSLYATDSTYTMAAGQTTIIEFSETNSHEVKDATEWAKSAGYFPRLWQDGGTR